MSRTPRVLYASTEIMSWYDVFSSFYDSSVEALYVPFREAAAARLEIAPGMRVLDAGCGTGQSFDLLSPAAGERGRVVGVDLSSGMLSVAAKRIAKKGLENVRLARSSLLELDRSVLAEHLDGARGFDRALCFLVLSALPDFEEATRRVWSLVEPGGTMMIVDAHAEKLGFQGRMVNLTARADIRRPVWRELERLAEAFTLERLEAPRSVGGDIVIARGRKPR